MPFLVEHVESALNGYRGAPSDSLFAVEIGVPHVRLIGFEITNWPVSEDQRSAGVNITASDVLLDRLVVHRPTSDTPSNTVDGIFVHNANSTVVRNSFVFNVGRAGIHMRAGNANRLDVLGCSLAKCMQASTSAVHGCVSVEGSSNSLRLINTLSFINRDGAIDYVATTMTLDSRSNINSPLTSFFINMATGDLHLASTPPLLMAGVYLDSLGIDIDGENRPGPDAGPWLIGADHVDIADAGPN